MVVHDATALESLRSRGGVHRWAIWVFIYVPIGLAFIGIVAAVLVPMFAKMRGH
jgi:hypothetical protein